MLANGAKLSYDKTNKGTSFTELPGLKKIPDMGIEKEKVENSSLDDAVKVYEFGIGDPGDLEYTFKYDNSKATSSYRLMRELEKNRSYRNVQGNIEGRHYNYILRTGYC